MVKFTDALNNCPVFLNCDSVAYFRKSIKHNSNTYIGSSAGGILQSQVYYDECGETIIVLKSGQTLYVSELPEVVLAKIESNNPKMTKVLFDKDK